MRHNIDSGFALLHDWLAAKFAFTPDGIYRHSRLQVVTQGYGRCMLNQSLHRTPLTIGQQTFSRGLGTHAVSEIRVVLPSAGATFQAKVGRNQNIHTAGQQARIVFSVETDGQERYRSPLLHGGEAPAPVDVPLHGALELTLKVGGDAHWGHADWADAQVLLENGQTVWLDELPFQGVVPDGSPEPPFSFRYGGQASWPLLETWRRAARTERLDAERTRQEVIYTDPKTGLEIRCEAVVFRDFPAVEWVLYLTNTGPEPAPVLEEIQSLNLRLDPEACDDEVVLHHAVGSICAARDFAPLAQVLPPASVFTLAPDGGRSSSGTMPFFNLASAGGGVIGAIGWSGQWRAVFTRAEGSQVHLQAGQEKTRIALAPGETIRTPRMTLLFWKGERTIAHNQWRSLVLKHYSPRPLGKPLDVPLAFGMGGLAPEAELVRRAHGLDQARLSVDCFWVDAGWYGECQGTETAGWELGDNWFSQAGNWHPNPRLFPRGLKPIADAVHRKGRKFLLWIECERVYENTRVFRDHPDWLLRLDPALQGHDPKNHLLNLGCPDARQWVTDLISDLIVTAGLDMVRFDFNVEPLWFWRHADAADRQGITEIRYIEGLYAFWDELLRRHPQIAIDNCASGGRRLDLELCRRSVPLWRSDLQCSPDYSALGTQCQTFGLASWLPLSSAGTTEYGNTYDFRSALGSGVVVNWQPFDRVLKAPAWARKRLAEAALARPYFQGDFYPLTRYSLNDDDWLAYQLDRPDLNGGVILAFRREKSPHPAAIFKLRALDPNASYEVRNMDSRRSRVMAGRQLAEHGLPMELRDSPASAIVHYQKMP